MNNPQSIDVSNLCSRKLVELLKNGEWNNTIEKSAIERELADRRHYLNELSALNTVTATRH